MEGTPMLNTAKIEAADREQKFARYRQLLRQQDHLSSDEQAEILALSKALGRNLQDDSSIVSRVSSMTVDKKEGDRLRKNATEARIRMEAAGPARQVEIAQAHKRYVAAVQASKDADAEHANWAIDAAKVDQFFKDNADLLSE
jgi:hypothetical protein